jgi:hypothetical protein
MTSTQLVYTFQVPLGDSQLFRSLTLGCITRWIHPGDSEAADGSPISLNRSVATGPGYGFLSVGGSASGSLREAPDDQGSRIGNETCSRLRR